MQIDSEDNYIETHPGRVVEYEEPKGGVCLFAAAWLLLVGAVVIALIIRWFVNALAVAGGNLP